MTKNLQLKLQIFILGLLLSLSSVGVAQIANRPALPFKVANNTPFPDTDIYVAIVGEDLSGVPGKHVWVDCKTGAQHPMDRSLNVKPGPVYVWLGDPNQPGIPARNNTEGNRNPDGTALYADCFTKLSDIPSKTIPLLPIQGCRVFISVKSPLFFFFFGASGSPSGYTSPSPTDPTDPNQGILYEMIELTYDQWGYFANTTRVDAYRYPMGMEVSGNDTVFINPKLARPALIAPSNIKQIGVYKKVGEFKTHDQIVAAFKAFAPVEFQGCLNPTTGEIKAPSKTIGFADGTIGTMPNAGPYKDYMKPYIDAIWAKYANEDLIFNSGDAGYWKGRVIGNQMVINSMSPVGGPFYGRTGVIAGKPTTQEVLEGKGILDHVVNDRVPDLMLEAQLCAAMNRHAIDVTTPNVGLQYLENTTNYYLAGPANFYSKFFHQTSISLDGRSYGFCYDDVWDQSSSCPTLYPTQVIATIGGYASQVIDTVKPSVPTNLKTVSTMNSIKVSWKASTDNVGVTGYLVYNGTTLLTTTQDTSFLVSSLNQNTIYTLSVQSKDLAGNLSAKASITASTTTCGDNVAPTAVSNLSATTTANSASITWTAATDNVGVKGYQVFMNGALAGTTINLNYQFTGLTPLTSYDVIVAAYDACGNVSTQKTLTVVTQSLPVCAGSATGVTGTTFTWTASADANNPSITFIPGTGAASGPVSLSYTVNNGAQQNVATNSNTAYTIQASSGQTVKFYYTYNRTAGGQDNNLGTPSTFTVGQCGSGDQTPPTTPTNLVASPASQSIGLSWTASTDNVGVTQYNIYSAGVLVGSTAYTTYTVSNLAFTTTYTITVEAQDAALNHSAKAQVIATTLSCSDTQAPTQPTALQTSVSQNSISLSWNAATDNVGVVNYLVYNNGTQVASVTGLSSVLTGLTANTTYTVGVKAVDGCGNISPLASVSATTQAIATCSANSTGSGGSKFSWTASSDAVNPSITFIPGTGVGSGVCILNYTVNNGAQLNVNVTMNSPYTITANAGQTVSFYYTYATTTGQDNNMSNKASFVVGACAPADQQAPTVPVISTTVPTSNSVTVSWSPSTDNVAVAGYHVYNGSSLVATVTTTSYTFASLSSTTSYSFYVDAFDAAGNASAKANTNATTLACSDSQAPTTPSNLVATPSVNYVDLTWSAATDNVGVTAYNIYQNNVFLASTSTLTYRASSLTASTNYTFSVVSVDACSNISAKANVATTTQANLTCTGSSVGVAGSNFTWVVNDQTTSPTILFVPGTGVGSGTCILSYTVNNGAPQNVSVSMNVPYTITAPVGSLLSFYYTYTLAAGGQDNNLQHPVKFTLGSCTQTVVKSMSVIHSTISHDFKVYPNPANEQLFIQLDENDTYETVQLLDLNGKLLINKSTENQTSLRLDVSGLPAGIYLLRVQGQNSFSFQKFIKN